jgi:anthrone oxygenase-like protein
MPFFMTATVASAIPVLSATKDRGSAEFRLTMAGMLCFAAMLAVTLTGNVPINRRILELPAREESYGEFLELRRRWDRLHRARNLLNVAGFALSCLGALLQPGPRAPAE